MSTPPQAGNPVVHANTRYHVNLSNLYRELDANITEEDYTRVAVMYFCNVLTQVQGSIKDFLRAEAVSSGGAVNELGACLCEAMLMMEAARTSKPELCQGVVKEKRTTPIPTPDVFFHNSVETNHILRALAPDTDVVINLEVILSLCTRLLDVFDAGMVAQFVVRIVFMQCADFTRTVYARVFANTYMGMDLDSSSDPPSLNTRILLALFLTHLFEHAFNSAQEQCAKKRAPNPGGDFGEYR
jgi:hypothetical protein